MNVNDPIGIASGIQLIEIGLARNSLNILVRITPPPTLLDFREGRNAKEILELDLVIDTPVS